MKTRLRIFGLILSCLLVVFMAACDRDQDDRVGTYTLIHLEVEIDGEVESASPPDVTGTLILHSDASFSMRVDTFVGSGSSESVSGVWTSNTFILDNDPVFYSFDGRTIEFTVTIDIISATYTWQKI